MKVAPLSGSKNQIGSNEVQLCSDWPNSKYFIFIGRPGDIMHFVEIIFNSIRMPKITGTSLTMNHKKSIDSNGFITGKNVINYGIKGRILRCNFWKVVVGGYFS